MSNLPAQLTPQVKQSLSRRKSVKTEQNGKLSQKRRRGGRGFDRKYADGNKFLATLDIFAGCGGLSSGLEQSGNLKFYHALEIIRVYTRPFHPELILINFLQVLQRQNGQLNMNNLQGKHLN